MPSQNIFRPGVSPARELYDSVVESLEKARANYSSFDISRDRLRAETSAVQAGITPILAGYRLATPSRHEVLIARREGSGHVDGLVKWTLSMLDFSMRPITTMHRRCPSCRGKGQTNAELGCVSCYGEGHLPYASQPEEPARVP